MFAKSSPIQRTLFSSTEDFLHGKSLIFYKEDTSWHNLFRREITLRIDEAIFKPLYSSGMGAPNASIRVLVAMMILKESQGWSDSCLFEQCRFNILTRSALGLLNIDDALPVESTYYLFRKLVVEHERNTGENLFEKAFRQVTGGQIKEYNVSGKQIRMDSFLLGSNIVWYTRYELIHETLRLFLKEIAPTCSLDFLTEDERSLFRKIVSEKGDKVVYRSSKEEVCTRLQEFGSLIYKILSSFKGSVSENYKTLETVFGQQFSKDKESGRVLPLAKEQIKSDSIQSPHDTDCSYRDKDGNQIKGYSINIAETCNLQKNALNLLTDLRVEKAGFADNNFFVPSLERSAELLEEKAESVYTDGAYHSTDNEQYCQKEEIKFIRGKIQGAESRYELYPGETPEDITVVDTHTGGDIPVEKTCSKKDGSIRWRIKIQNREGKQRYRYFTRKDLETSVLRRTIGQIPQTELNKRNNVEASVFQMTYHYSNDKSRYRTLCRHKMWAVVRALWVNFRRILKYIKQTCQRTFFPGKNRLDVSFFNTVFNLFVPMIFLFDTIFPEKRQVSINF